MWTSVRRGSLLATLALAGAACMVQAAIELVSQSVVGSLLGLVLVSYGANYMRSGAANMLTGLVSMAIVVQFLVKGAFLPSSQMLVLLVAPMATVVGGALSLRLHARER